MSPEELNKHFDDHVKYLEKYYEQNIFVAWGRKAPPAGGVIFALAESKETVEDIIKEDPFYEYKLAEITVTELTLAKYHPSLDLLSK
ncbi:MAG TPA: YciI family protein [Mucilaginibacter sp.]|nr:YciI family protein [Mucilaginibacter sp.]